MNHNLSPDSRAQAPAPDGEQLLAECQELQTQFWEKVGELEKWFADHQDVIVEINPSEDLSNHTLESLLTEEEEEEL